MAGPRVYECSGVKLREFGQSATPCVPKRRQQIQRGWLRSIPQRAYRSLRTEPRCWFGMSKEPWDIPIVPECEAVDQDNALPLWKQRPLTLPPSAPYDREYPIPRLGRTGGGEQAVSVSRPNYTLLFRLIALSVSLGLWCSGRPVRAGGCHVEDRPVLGSSLFWDQDTDLRSTSVPIISPPRVLTHPPCSGESPRLVDSSGAAPCALWQGRAEFAGRDPSDALASERHLRHQQPPSERLDRPPRSSETGVTMKVSG